MGVGPPITQSPHTSGCPRGDFGPHKSTHTSPSPTFIGDTCEPRGGGWAPPPACPTPPSLPGFSWVWGKGMWQPPGLLLSTHPPTPCPESCSAPTAEIGEHGGGGAGGGGTRVSVSSQLRAAAAPAGVMGAQWVLSCCSSCAAWGQSGDNHCWDRVRSLHGWWDEDRAPPPPVLAWTRCWQHSPAAAGKVTVSAQLPVPACS